MTFDSPVRITKTGWSWSQLIFGREWRRGIMVVFTFYHPYPSGLIYQGWMRQIHKVHVLHIVKTRASIPVSFLEQGHYFSFLVAFHLSPSSVGIPGHLLMNVTSLKSRVICYCCLGKLGNSCSILHQKHLLSLTSKISSWFVRSKKGPVITLPTSNDSYGKEFSWNAEDPGSIPGLKR